MKTSWDVPRELESRRARNGGRHPLPAHLPENPPASQSPHGLPIDSPASQSPGGLPEPGERIGQYEIIRELGRGGMGAVFLARDTKLGRRAAIKFLHNTQPEITARFILEARATARCNHENIIVIYEVGEYCEQPYMALEYLEGAPLDKQLAKNRRLSPARAVELMVPVVRALACAHAHNIVHRDLKPDNIFVTSTGTVKVLDFGIAKLVHAWQRDERMSALAEPAEIPASEVAENLTQRGAIIGTLPFMSPEQWGVDTVDHRTDLWAVGIMLYRMLTGEHPLAPLRGMQLVVTGMLNEPMPRVHDKAPDVPAELAAIVDRCLVKPKDQRMASAQELFEALEPLLPSRHARKLQAHQSPYAGLSAFQEADADRFFGRSHEIMTALARLREQPLLGIVGASGVGKSSFVRAGIVPALRQAGESWSPVVVRPGRQPVEALAHVAGTLVRGSSSTMAGELSEHHALIQRLYMEPGFLGTVMRSYARRTRQKLLLFVDQFEELYTMVASERERLVFTACLASLADDATTPLRVVLSIRSDFLDRVSEDAYFMAELSRGLFFLSPPGRDGLREALLQPAEMAGYQFESAAMVEEMLDHLEHTPGALPLLQFAASKLWEMRDRQRHLFTDSSYRQIGGIAGALASHADEVIEQLPSQSRALVRALMLLLVTPERTRAVVPLRELLGLSPAPGEVERLISQLVEARLLVVHTVDAEASVSVEIVHESLLQSWPRLRRWLDENQDDAAVLEQLRTAARQWQARGRPHGLLWRGQAADEARHWHRRYRGELPELQRAYLAAVFALGARAARLKRVLLGSVIVFLSLLVSAGAVALVTIRDAERESARQAQAAREAEQGVREQLERVRAEQEARRVAEDELRATLEELRQANVDVQQAKGRLEHQNAQLAMALERAKRSRRRARKASREMLRSAEVALHAEAEARAAVEEMETRLAQAEKRARDVEIKISNMIDDNLIHDVPLEK